MLEERPRGPQYPRQGLGGALPSAQGSGDILPQALRPLRLASLGSSGPPFVRFLKDEEILLSYTDGQSGFTGFEDHAHGFSSIRIPESSLPEGPRAGSFCPESNLGGAGTTVDEVG